MLRHLQRVFALAAIVMLCLGLSACPATRQPVPGPGPTGEPPPLKAVSGAELFQIQPQASQLRILVYRGGALAQAGHNHVIASHDLSGQVYLHKDLRKSGFDVSVPVAKLTVDEPELRQQEGAEFQSQVGDSARAGTHKNMLSEALLDAERYPQIRLVSASVGGDLAHAVVKLRIGIKQRWSELQLPVAVQRQGNKLQARGSTDLKQSDLGLTPFTALLGALQVQDRITVRFEITAQSSG